jgi:DNA primase
MDAAATSSGVIEVGGRRLVIRNLDRVVFPRAGTTKAQLLDYYIRIAGAMLPHLRDRLLHMHRYPEGVEGPRFWQKGCPEHRPPWMQTAPVWSAAKGEPTKTRPTVSTPVEWDEVEAAAAMTVSDALTACSRRSAPAAGRCRRRIAAPGCRTSGRRPSSSAGAAGTAGRRRERRCRRRDDRRPGRRASSRPAA